MGAPSQPRYNDGRSRAEGLSGMHGDDPVWTVLVVDDSDDYREAACSWIETLDGLRVAGTARDGDSALEQAGSLRPDLILMDAAMPGTDGFEATRRLKARPDAPRIVIMSLHDSVAIREVAWISGADGFVAKADLTAAFPALVRDLRSGADLRLRDGRASAGSARQDETARIQDGTPSLRPSGAHAEGRRPVVPFHPEQTGEDA